MFKLLIVALTCLQARDGIAQIRLSVAYKDKPLSYVIKDIQAKIDKGDFIPDACFRYTRLVTYKANNQPLDTILKHVFEGQPLEHKLYLDCLNIFPRTVKGRVTDENGIPLEGVSINGVNKYAATDKYGYYEIPMGACDSIFQFTSVGRQTHIEVIRGRTWAEIVMRIKHEELDEKKVYHNGYDVLPKERVTGSFFTLGEPDVKRQVLSNAIDAWEDRVPGLSYNKNLLSWNNQPNIEVRGASTIHADTGPLIVIDNFPIQSRQVLEMLNPQDILSVTVLKDAAATSIWGVRAGNGVIVVTTKTGKYNKPMKVFVSNSTTLASKRDVWYMPSLTSSEYIKMETARYEAGYYKSALNDRSALISPVVEILNKKIPKEEKDEMLRQISTQDVRYDLEDLFYRNALTHRHFISVDGGSANTNYYLSAGYDRELMSLVTADRKRFTSNGGIQIKRKKFEFSMNNYFSYGLVHNDRAAPEVIYPFTRLKNNDGKPNTVFANFKQSFKDSMNQFLQNWDYKPLQELYERTLTQRNIQYRLSFTGNYTILKGLDFKLIYQHDQGRVETDDLSSAASYEARNLENSFASVKNGSVEYVIPKGGILDWQLSEYRSDKVRTQMNFKSKTWKRFQMVALGGFEASAIQTDTTSFRFYGFYGDRRRPVLDYLNTHVQSYDSSRKELIPQIDNTSSGNDYFTSYYGNAGINYSNRYTFSFSTRFDRSNLFGAKTNRKSIPLGSIGFKWDASEEAFYPFKEDIPYLSFRASLGYSGNISKATSAYISAMPTQTNQGTIYSIITPANPDLRWEKSKMLNFGFTLTDKNRHYFLAFDYYSRKSRDLMGPGEQDPIMGTSTIWGNFAELKGKGYELSLQTDHNVGEIRIENLVLISRSTNKVTQYYNTHNDAGYFVDNRYLRPREGYPVYPLLAFAWAGLESTTGDPRGYLNGNPSKDYNAIIQSPVETLVNKGSSVPTLFGNLRPLISWRNLKFSFTMSGKFGYSFRRSSVNYFDPYSTKIMGRNDFSRQWQKGAENTNVPSMQISTTEERDHFYSYSEVLVERGDHIRLQDVRFEFDCQSLLPKAWKIHSMTAYVYAANLGIIWSANKLGIDPDFQLGPPVSKSITTGFSFEF